MYTVVSKSLSRQQYNYFYLSMLQLNQSINSNGKVILAALNNIQGYGFIVRFLFSSNKFAIEFLNPRKLNEEGVFSEWGLSSLIAFNDITVEQVLGFEDSEESKENKGGSFASSTVNLPSKIKLYKVGSNDESYIFNPRDHIFMQGIRQILEFLHDIKTNAQSQVNQTLITRSYQDLSDEMLEKIFHRYHQADYFRAQPTSMFHQFVMSYGEKQKGLSTYQQWITDAINNNKLIIDEHFIDQPAFIQQHSTLRLFRDLNNVFTDGFGFIQLVDNNQNLKNGTYAFQITDDFKYLELYPVTLITYIHSNVKPFLLYSD